jgi:hypothetical protein
MNILLVAVCFLLVFCGHGHHGHRHAQSAPTAQTEVGPKQQNARGRSCEQITNGFDSWGNQDDWVSEFPVDQQHRVLVCLDKLAKKQGLQ